MSLLRSAVRWSRKPGQGIRPGFRRSNALAAALAASGLLTGCAATPPRDVLPHLSEYGAHAVQVTTVGGLHFARFISYLPGDQWQCAPAVEMREVSDLDDARGRIQVIGFEQQEGVKEVAMEMASQLLGIPEALNFLLPFKMERIDLEITLIPEGCLYTMTDWRILRGQHIKAGFAFRAGENLTLTRRHVLRTVAHELFHTLLRMNGIPRGETSSPQHAKEEDAAVAIEACAELHITGSTSQGLWKDWDIPEKEVAPSEAAVSLTAAARMHRIWGDLFSDDPSAENTMQQKVDQLHAICRDLVAEVLAQGSSASE